MYNLTTNSFTFDSPALQPGQYKLIVFETDTGNKLNSLFSFEYVLFVASFSPTIGSIRGGTLLQLNGDGFSSNNCYLNKINFAQHPCHVLFCTSKWIQCRTSDAYKVHKITNAGNHPIYGLGYAWSEPLLNISAGETVTWSWRAPSGILNIAYRIAQVQDSQSFIEEGFSSGLESTSIGSFTKVFHLPGIYNYWSDYVDSEGKISLRGTIIVQPVGSFNLPMSLHLNGFEAQMVNPDGYIASNLSSAVCAGSAKTDSECGYSLLKNPFEMTFTGCSIDPVIFKNVYPQYVSFDEIVVIEGEGFSQVQCETDIFIGGVLCEQIPGNWTTSQLFCRLGMGSGLATGVDHQVEVLVKNFGYALHSKDKLTIRFMPKVSFLLLMNYPRDLSTRHISIKPDQKNDENL